MITCMVAGPLKAVESMCPDIKRIEDDDQLIESAKVIREAFMTVADGFGITRENTPTNPAFIRTEDLRAMREKGILLFGAYAEGVQIGFFALEKSDAGLYYLKRLAVLPEFRHRGCGKKMMDHAVAYVREQGGNTISIGMIDANSVLKKWYANYGFMETEIKRFNHLPFDICFMKKELYNMGGKGRRILRRI